MASNICSHLLSRKDSHEICLLYCTLFRCSTFMILRSDFICHVFFYCQCLRCKKVLAKKMFIVCQGVFHSSINCFLPFHLTFTLTFLSLHFHTVVYFLSSLPPKSYLMAHLQFQQINYRSDGMDGRMPRQTIGWLHEGH